MAGEMQSIFPEGVKKSTCPPHPASGHPLPLMGAREFDLRSTSPSPQRGEGPGVRGLVPIPSPVTRHFFACWTAFLCFVPVTLAQEGYIGAQACGSCHASDFEIQSQSHHARALHSASDAQWLEQVPAGIGSESADPNAARFEFRKSRSDLQVTVTVGTNRLALPVQWIFGANDQGLTFFSRLDDGRFVEHRLTY